MSTAQAGATNLELEAAGSRAVVDLEHGGRLASLVVAGYELLGGIEAADVPMAMSRGCYPMAPWAGRVRNGRFSFQGNEYQLPINLGAHALHGFGLDAAWASTSATTIELELAPRWPLAGRLTQAFELTGDELIATITATATTHAMPVTLGFHPWFRRYLADGASASLSFDADSQYLRDDDGLPDGTLVSPLPGPWDDCFIVPSRQIAIAWPGALLLRVRSDHDHFVVYDERAEALCVEPQTGPPDAYNLPGCQVLEPGQSTSLTMRLQWTKL